MKKKIILNTIHFYRSTENNPKIFLTWNFIDNEHQAYTPPISANQGKFHDCSCKYEGPWSDKLYKYLKQVCFFSPLFNHYPIDLLVNGFINLYDLLHSMVSMSRSI